jgi:hypothetical protein
MGVLLGLGTNTAGGRASVVFSRILPKPISPDIAFHLFGAMDNMHPTNHPISY